MCDQLVTVLNKSSRRLSARAEATEVALRNARFQGELASSAHVTERLRQQLDEIRQDRDQWRSQARRVGISLAVACALDRTYDRFGQAGNFF
jgi:hypothetical protein